MEYENEDDCIAQIGSTEFLKKADCSLHTTGNMALLLLKIIM